MEVILYGRMKIKQILDAMLIVISKKMPEVQIISDEKSIDNYGGDETYFAPPSDYDIVTGTCALW